MSISLHDYLDSIDSSYRVITHDKSLSSAHTASTSHISGKKLAKGVLLRSDNGYLLAVIPSNRKVDLSKISHITHQRLGLATEEDITEIFNDCDPGAIPPIGQAYGLDMLVDDRLIDSDDLYCEGGDHESLIHISSNEFRYVMQGAVYGNFSCPENPHLAE